MKLLIGGSPCTYWSIAQTKNRETEASGMGWELFKNYVIARDKYQPDYFLYENNKSMSPAIRAQITAVLGVEPVLINSALVSAQNRQRLYWCGKRDADGSYSTIPIEQPEDRGILLRDVLESGVCWREKGYTIDANYWKTPGQIGFDTQAGRRKMVAEPVCVTSRGRYIGEGGSVEQHFEVQESGKTNTLTTVQKDNMIAESVNCSAEVLNVNPSGHGMNGAVIHVNGKSRTLTTNKGEGQKIIEPVRIGTIENDAKTADFDSQQYRVYSPDGKSVTLCGNGGGVGAKTGLYACPASMAWRGHAAHGNPSSFEMRKDGKSNAVIVGHQNRLVIDLPDGKTMPVYEVRDGKITIKGKQYPIKLRDGCYIIRKLTVRECMRLQTVPEDFEFPVSNSQAYKMLGNGWTVDVIAHIMSHMDGITTEPVDVLSMYDGMACGHIALDKLGANIRNYFATEIDKYAVKTATHNFPDIVELGDAFQVRADDWRLDAL